MTGSLLLVGTRKGLWIGRSEDRTRWDWDPPAFFMDAIYSVCIDTRGTTPRLLVGATSEHWGPQVFRSDDLGASWQETPNGAIRFPEDTGTALERVWQICPGTAAEPDVLYAGSQPSALFRSADGGVSFDLVRPLWDHPHRPEWNAGYGGQAIHSILPHPENPAEVTVAMSTGGVYRTTDGGDSWDPANQGISAYFFPDPYPEFGQCVHKIAGHPARPERMYAQNHRGVFRSDDAGASWTSIAEGLPADFGFPIVVDPHDPDRVWVFPLVSDFDRLPPDGEAAVWRSDDAGASWTRSRAGLPDGFFSAVMRDAMTTDDAPSAGLYLGARDGSVYASLDAGETFEQIAAHLPDVYSVRAATLV